MAARAMKNRAVAITKTFDGGGGDCDDCFGAFFGLVSRRAALGAICEENPVL
jgi:hypothetical protein